MNTFYISYLITINTFSYLIYFYDKRQAIKGNYRISELSLLLLVLFGGILGALFSMLRHKHKTKKTSFIFKYVLVSILFIISINYMNNNFIKYL